MTRRDFTDANFEVISGPTPVRWQKPRSRPVRGLGALSWVWWGLIVAVALFTAAMGLGGADLDTRDAVATDAAQQAVAVSVR